MLGATLGAVLGGLSVFFFGGGDLRNRHPLPQTNMLKPLGYILRVFNNLNKVNLTTVSQRE